MRSFGELLTEHLTRAGISDSELARHLGVSRQTIFRWKEGHTARPRVRDDVLKIAARLRLTDAERDELLLAAGFAPQSANVPVSASAPTSGASPTPTLPAESSSPERLPAQSRTHPPRLGLMLVAIALVLGVAISVTLLVTRENGQFRTPTPFLTPLAASSEQVILLGRLRAEGGDAPNYDVTARLRQAIEREMDAARMERVRVILSPGEIADAQTAEAMRTRVGAEIVAWGSYQGDTTRLFITSAAAPNPTPLQFNNGSNDDVRALALSLVAQIAFKRGQTDAARAALTQAGALPNLAPDLGAYLSTQQAALK